MPTAHPRYAVTDTGAVRAMLDEAQRRWPDVSDRKQLLLRLAAVGRDALAGEAAAEAHGIARQAQDDALARASELVDEDVLLADSAWR